MNLAASFQDLMDSIYTRYRGCLIENCGGYRTGGKTFATMEAAKKSIDESLDGFWKKGRVFINGKEFLNGVEISNR